MRSVFVNLRSALVAVSMLVGCGGGADRAIQVYDISTSAPQMMDGQAVTNVTMTVQVPDSGQHRMQATYSESLTRGMGDASLAVRAMDGTAMPLEVQLSETYAAGTIKTPLGSVSYQANADGTYQAGARRFDTEEAMLAAVQSDPALTGLPAHSLVAASTAMDVLETNNTQLATTRGFWSWVKKACGKIFKWATCAVLNRFNISLRWCG